jgi:RimJ/RimL family protein N-acetyltransferase
MVLRRFTAQDEQALAELDSDPQVMFHVTGGRPQFQPDDLAVFVGPGFWAAEDHAGHFLGWFHLRPEGREPELGYRLRRAEWGKGYATEGSRALIDHAFRMGAQRVSAHALAVHTASRRVIEKAGMRLVREYHGDWPDRIPGDEYGDVEYAITREEWLGAGEGLAARRRG